MQCPFFQFSWSSRWRAESLHTHTHTHAPGASFAGIPTADINCCRLPIFLCSLFPTVLSLFLLCIDVAHPSSPPHFFFALDWDETLRPHPALPPFLSLFSARKFTPLFTTCLSTSHFTTRLYIANCKKKITIWPKKIIHKTSIWLIWMIKWSCISKPGVNSNLCHLTTYNHLKNQV